ncbi:MAG: FkbM family methyltransferase [Candidatus Caldarchaeum sp.]
MLELLSEVFKAYFTPPIPKLILYRLKWSMMRKIGVNRSYIQSLDTLLSEPKWFVGTIKNWSDTFIDVGAGVGDYVARTKSRKIYCFEPDLRCAKTIYSKAGGRDIVVYFCALGNYDGTTSFTMTNSLKHSTMILDRNGCRSTVLVYKLDTLTFGKREIIPEGNVLVKIDTEGAEHLVLEGAKVFVKVYRPTVLIEYHENLPKVIKCLKQLSYRIDKHLSDRYTSSNHGWLLCVPE